MLLAESFYLTDPDYYIFGIFNYTSHANITKSKQYVLSGILLSFYRKFGMAAQDYQFKNYLN